MILGISGKIQLRVENLRPYTAIGESKMSVAELVLDGSSTTCVIRNVVRGNVEKLGSEPVGDVSLTISKSMSHTAHTKKGFVDILITTESVQFYVYVHADHLEKFLSACAMSTIRAGLGL